MDGVSVTTSSSVEENDYLDALGNVLPWHRPFTYHERLLIVLVVTTFVSFIGCILICLVCSQSTLRRRFAAKRKLDIEKRILVPSAPRKDIFECSPSPPQYNSIVKTDDASALNELRKSRYLDLGRKSSCGTATDSDGGVDHSSTFNEKIFPSSLSNGNTSSTKMIPYILPPFAQFNVELNIDLTKNLLIVHLTNGEHVSSHPAFDDQAEFFVHIQLINNKILKKFHDVWKKRRSSLQLNTWKNVQEKTTKKLSRTADGTLACDEYLQFELNNDEISLTSLRFLLFSIDRSGIEDLMSESLIRLNSSMMPNYQQHIQFKDPPQITFGEIFLGISYLPTAKRLTIKFNKLRYFCKTEKDQKIHARLIATFFHHGRRFFQKKLPTIKFNQTIPTDNNIYEINDTIVQNILQTDIQSIYVHFELVIHILNLKTESIISCGSVLLGEQTRYKTDWLKMLEQPRQIHYGWYQFFG